MVIGLDRFKEHFAGYADRYVLIGGTASSLSMEELGSEFRATKDLDLVLCVETLDRFPKPMMSTQEQHKQPAHDEIRAARIAGFTDSISHLSPVWRERLLEVYQKQDARREANLANLRVRTE